MTGSYVIGAVAVTALILAAFLTRQQSGTVPGEASAKQRRLTQNIAAYELYLRGRDPALFRSDSGPVRGLAFLDEAIALDSTFAAAYAAKAYLYWVLAKSPDPDARRKYWRLADSTATRSIVLDPRFPRYGSDLVSQKPSRCPTSKKPSQRCGARLSLVAHRVRAILSKVLLWRGKIDESIRESRIALDEDPLSASASADLPIRFASPVEPPKVSLFSTDWEHSSHRCVEFRDMAETAIRCRASGRKQSRHSANAEIRPTAKE